MNEKLTRLKSYAVARAQESSTWRGLILIAAGCGAVLRPEQQEAIIAGGVMFAGLVGALTADGGKRDAG